MSDCIIYLLDNPGKWQPSRGDLWTYLKLLIRRHIGHLATSYENTHNTRFNVPLESDIEMQSLEDFKSLRLTPPQETTAELEETARFIEVMSWSSDDVRRVANAMLRGDTEPKEIAATCSLSVRKVYVIKREIARKMQALVATPPPAPHAARARKGKE